MAQVDTGVDAIRRVLRERGLHATSARIAVLQVLGEEHHHRSAEEVRAEVLERCPAIDLATVYRTLETLEEHGLVVRMELGDKLTRWAYVIPHHHHHLACRNCKAVVELDDAPFRRLGADLMESHGVVVEIQHMVLRGLCPVCAAIES